MTRLITILQILENYTTQLTHLAKELEEIKAQWTQWEVSQLPTSSSGPFGRR